MNIAQKELINIVREELKEALGMDQEYERSQLAAKVRDLLDEYTGEDLEAAMDALNAVRAMLSAEMEEYDEVEPPEEPGRAGVVRSVLGRMNEAIEDLEWEGPPGINDFDGGVQIVNSRHGTDVFLNDRLVATGFFDNSADAFFMEKSSKSFNSMPEMATHYGQRSGEMQREDFFSDSAKEEEAEAKQRAAQGETEDKEDDPGQYVTTSEACPGKPKRYFKLK